MSEDLALSDNNAAIERLQAQVSSLRDLSITIGRVAREDVSLLGEMQTDMSRTSSLMKTATSRVTALLNSGSGANHLALLAAFALCVFFALYFLVW
jgi:hypothetical protein